MATRISDDGEFDDAGGEGGRRDRALNARAIRALAIAIHRRLRAANVDQMTPAQWQNLIQDEWTNRKQAGD